MGGDDDAGCFNALFGPAHKTIAFAAIVAAVVGSPGTRIGGGKTFDAGGNTFPGGNFLGEERQFAAFAGQGCCAHNPSLARPRACSAVSCRWVRCRAAPNQRCAAEIAAAFAK